MCVDSMLDKDYLEGQTIVNINVSVISRLLGNIY